MWLDWSILDLRNINTNLVNVSQDTFSVLKVKIVALLLVVSARGLQSHWEKTKQNTGTYNYHLDWYELKRCLAWLPVLGDVTFKSDLPLKTYCVTKNESPLKFLSLLFVSLWIYGLCRHCTAQSTAHKVRNGGYLSVVELCFACSCFFKLQADLFAADTHLHPGTVCFLLWCSRPFTNKFKITGTLPRHKGSPLRHLASWAAHVHWRNRDVGYLPLKCI